MLRIETVYNGFDNPQGPPVVTHDKVINEKGEMIGVSFARQNAAYFHYFLICMTAILFNKVKNLKGELQRE